MEDNSDWQSSEEEEDAVEEEQDSVEEADSGEEEEESEEEEEEEGEELEVQEPEGEDAGENAKYYDDRPTKRSKVLLDRISELPDSIITHILSLMPTRDAVKTSALSKRWHHTWASTSALIYIHDWVSLKNFTKFVDRTLILHKSSKIHQFVLQSEYRNSLQSSANLWVHAAIIKQVEELSIDFSSNSLPTFLLPQSLYSCDSLTTLRLVGCRIAPSSLVHWASLKHLSVSSCPQLDDGLIQNILNGSPLLESLELKNSGMFGCIKTNSMRLRSLVINSHREFSRRSDIGWIEIDAPNLQSLAILGYMQKKCRLKNVQSLLHANFTFFMRNLDDHGYPNDDTPTRVQDSQNMVKDLMEKVRYVQNLTIGTWILQVLSAHELKHSPFSISMCKCLVLEIALYHKDLPGIAILLRTSPILERLVIDMSLSQFHWLKQITYIAELKNFDGTNYWTSKSVVSNCLKTVDIIGFSEFATELAQFLLKNAKALEKIVFTKRKGSDSRWQQYFGPRDFFKVIQKLLSFPRSSSQAQILLS